MRRVTAVRVLGNYRLELSFDDGAVGNVDLGDLAGRGVFEVWNEPGAFAKVRIGSSGELAWGDDIDLCPDSLYLRATGKKPEDLFSSLQTEPIDA